MSNLYKPVIMLLLSGALITSCKKSDYRIPSTPTSSSYKNELTDSFNSDTRNWSFIDPVNMDEVFLSNGLLYFTSHPNIANDTTFLSVTTTSIKSTANFALTTSILSDNVMGLSFGSNDTSKGYSFKLDQYGHFALFNEGSCGKAKVFLAPAPLINWAFSNSILLNQLNILQLEQIGNNWNGYINSTMIFTVSAKSFVGNRVGYIILNGTNGEADYLDIKW